MEKKTFKPKERVPSDRMEEAVLYVLNNKSSMRATSDRFNISKSALHRAVKHAQQLSKPEEFKHTPNIGNRRVFTMQQETSLVEYLHTASKMCYGLGSTRLRILAYNYAKELGVSYPPQWDQNNKASEDWLNGFKARHSKILSLRKPEKSSLSRATAFNPTTVNKFFDNLQRVMTKFNFTSDRIYNCDETGVTTVTDPPKVFAMKGLKQVGQATSAERGALVTVLNFINAAGGFIPPVFVSPRINFKTHMLNGAPLGSLGLSNKSGWMTENNFLISLKHFVKHVRPTSQAPVLLILDNHESHISLGIVRRVFMGLQDHLLLLLLLLLLLQFLLHFLLQFLLQVVCLSPPVNPPSDSSS
ncbi:hypothetical protein NQ315_005685 [Exocentrus adspersus]|uniref:HTH CENPB-type domain-containing protein n=1 Tax=Exocentrus adspersus TaxID=1586481 RepID=A0AAV8VI90_9CUCU|nr:hypothetical protein NQ315_005685 [Exocentrus adspersus]